MTTQPLDDVRDGSTVWRCAHGVSFCHWDRWFLRLALDEPAGLSAIAAALQGNENDRAEALLAQVTDLAARLQKTGLSPETMLDAEERASLWLRDKASRRIWHSAALISPTPAMARTPRKLLRQRARSGNWDAFQCSPGPTFTELCAAVGDGYADWRGAPTVLLLLRLASEDRLAAARDAAQLLAVRRGILGAYIEAIAHVDDSGGDLGEEFREHERAYLALLPAFWHDPRVLTDLLELVVWEDYGLFFHVEGWLAALPEPIADVVVRALARLIKELRVAGLSYQVGRATRLREATLRAVVELS